MGTSNTRTIQSSIDFCQFYLGRRPLAIGGANGLEPALTAANIVQQTILAPPFKWSWNRNTAAFSSTQYNSAIAIANFGFIEKAYYEDSTQNFTEIPNIKLELTPDAGIGPPNCIGVFLDDNNGNITFRVLPGVADQTYTINVIFQQRAILMTGITGTTGTWTIPDCFGQVYNYGFTAMMALFAGDERFGAFNSKFIGSLLAVAEGLSEQDKAIFIEQWNSVVMTQSYAGNRMSQGFQGRGQ